MRRPVPPFDLAVVPSRQRGLGTLDLVLAGFLAFVLLGAGGYLFRNLVREFRDIRDQVRIQAEMKSALQAMTRQIANMGALLADPLEGFSARPTRLAFAYVDVPGRYCLADSRVSVAFFAERAKREDRLIQAVTCADGKRQVRQLAATRTGGLNLAFRYLDKGGLPTTDRARIKSVELLLALETGPALAGGRMEKTRGQATRIQCVNL